MESQRSQSIKLEMHIHSLGAVHKAHKDTTHTQKNWPRFRQAYDRRSIPKTITTTAKKVSSSSIASAWCVVIAIITNSCQRHVQSVNLTFHEQLPSANHGYNSIVSVFGLFTKPIARIGLGVCVCVILIYFCCIVCVLLINAMYRQQEGVGSGALPHLSCAVLNSLDDSRQGWPHRWRLSLVLR